MLYEGMSKILNVSVWTEDPDGTVNLEELKDFLCGCQYEVRESAITFHTVNLGRVFLVPGMVVVRIQDSLMSFSKDAIQHLFNLEPKEPFRVISCNPLQSPVTVTSDHVSIEVVCNYLKSLHQTPYVSYQDFSDEEMGILWQGESQSYHFPGWSTADRVALYAHMLDQGMIEEGSSIYKHLTSRKILEDLRKRADFMDKND